MSEAVFVNLALTVRVLIVGGFLLFLPRVTRLGLLFGAYVGESSAEGDAARRPSRSWYRGCVVLMVVSLMVGYGISLAGRPVAGNFTGTAVLLLGALGLYLRTYSRARALAPPEAAQQAVKAAASLYVGEPRGAGLAKFALGFCIVAAVATFAYATVSYQAMTDRSFVAIMFVPSLNLVLSPTLALLALFTVNAKRSIRAGSGGGSVEAQDAFRATMVNLMSWTALLSCTFMTVLSVQIVRLGLSENASLGVWILWTAGLFLLFLVFLLGSMVRILKGYGQGGARLEQAAADAALTNGLADNARWVWGLFYVDRDDPSIMVEKRFGFGYTMNYGNRTAVLFVVGFLVLSMSVAAFVMIGALR
jgi:hypothetical protein